MYLCSKLNQPCEVTQLSYSYCIFINCFYCNIIFTNNMKCVHQCNCKLVYRYGFHIHIQSMYRTTNFQFILHFMDSQMFFLLVYFGSRNWQLPIIDHSLIVYDDWFHVTHYSWVMRSNIDVQSGCVHSKQNWIIFNCDYN